MCSDCGCWSSYLFLQPDYACPLLLQDALVLLLGRVIEAGSDIGLFPECLCCLGRIDDTQVGYYGLVPTFPISAIAEEYVVDALTALPPVGPSGWHSWRLVAATEAAAATMHYGRCSGPRCGIRGGRELGPIVFGEVGACGE